MLPFSSTLQRPVVTSVEIIQVFPGDFQDVGVFQVLLELAVLLEEQSLEEGIMLVAMLPEKLPMLEVGGQKGGIGDAAQEEEDYRLTLRRQAGVVVIAHEDNPYGEEQRDDSIDSQGYGHSQ